MDFGMLIRRAWAMTWGHRFLWALGLFATTTVGSCTLGGGGGGGGSTRWEVGSGDFQRFAPQMGDLGVAFGRWLADHPLAVAAGLLLFIVLALAMVFVSLVAQAGMATATADLARGRAVTPGSAWRAGWRLWGRYLALWLLLVAAAIGLALVIGAIIAVLLVGLGGLGNGDVGPIRLLVLVLLAIPAALAAALLAIAASVVVAYAQRAIAVEDVGAVEATRRGWRLFRAHLGDSLLTWLVSLALALGSGLALGAVVLLAALLVAAIGLALYSLAGLSTLTLLYAALGGLVIVATAGLLAAIANTFFWSFWTLAYLELAGEGAAT